MKSLLKADKVETGVAFPEKNIKKIEPSITKKVSGSSQTCHELESGNLPKREVKQHKNFVLDGPFDLKAVFKRTETLETIYDVSPQALVASAQKDIDSQSKGHIDPNIIQQAIKKTIFATMLLNAIGSIGAPFGFRKLYETLETLADCSNQKSASKLGAIKGLNSAQRKILDRLYDEPGYGNLYNYDKAVDAIVQFYVFFKPTSTEEQFKTIVSLLKRRGEDLKSQFNEPNPYSLKYLNFFIDMGMNGLELAKFLNIYKENYEDYNDHDFSYYKTCFSRCFTNVAKETANLLLEDQSNFEEHIKVEYSSFIEQYQSGNFKLVISLGVGLLEDTTLNKDQLRDIHEKLANSYYEQGMHQSAKEMVEKLKAPLSIETLQKKLDIYIALSEHENTQNIYIALLLKMNRGSDHYPAFIDAGLRHSILVKDYDNMYRFGDIAIAVYDNYLGALGKGYYYLHKQKFEKAEKNFLLAGSKGIISGYEELAQMYLLNNDILKIFEGYELWGHRTITGNIIKAKAFAKETFNKKATKCFEKALDCGAGYPELRIKALHSFAEFYEDQDQIKGMIKCFEQAQQVGDYQLAVNIGNYYLDKEEYESAFEYYKQAYQNGIEDGKNQLNLLAMMLQNFNKLELMKKCYSLIKDVELASKVQTTLDRSNLRKERALYSGNFVYDGDEEEKYKVRSPSNREAKKMARATSSSKEAESPSATHQKNIRELKSWRDVTIVIASNLKQKDITEDIKEMINAIANGDFKRFDFEYLIGDLKGFCSMRIDKGNRLVFKMKIGSDKCAESLKIYSVSGHYDNFTPSKQSFQLLQDDE